MQVLASCSSKLSLTLRTKKALVYLYIITNKIELHNVSENSLCEETMVKVHKPEW